MDPNRFRQIDLGKLPSPCFVVDAGFLEDNLKELDSVRKKTGCRILLALKAFSMYATFPLIRRYLDGVCASGLNEAKLGREEFDKEVHVFSPAYGEADFREILPIANTIVFNSFKQWTKYKKQALSAGKTCGIRVNPEHSDVSVALYNPCARFSRLGVPISEFDATALDGITGLHFHALCEQNSDALDGVAGAVEKKFGQFLSGMKWVNFGGGHHITREDYDKDRLCRIIDHWQSKYSVQVYLEPGEAVALNTGYLVTTVLDTLKNEKEIAILDTSAETHMPDILAMPYRPRIHGAGEPGQYKHTYRLGGMTCLAGDCIGDYSFPKPLMPGDKIVFMDMAHYSMVKTTTFNGVNLPSIALHEPSTGKTEVLRTFGYLDFKSRL